MLAYLMSRNEPKYNHFCKENYILWVKWSEIEMSSHQIYSVISTKVIAKECRILT